MEYPNETVIPVSAVLGENIQEFLKVLREMLIGKVR
jgi:hypothetical protein